MTDGLSPRCVTHRVGEHLRDIAYLLFYRDNRKPMIFLATVFSFGMNFEKTSNARRPTKG